MQLELKDSDRKFFREIMKEALKELLSATNTGNILQEETPVDTEDKDEDTNEKELKAMFNDIEEPEKETKSPEIKAKPDDLDIDVAELLSDFE